MRPLSILSVGLLVGALMLAGVVAPVSEEGVSLRPAEAASKVKVAVNCRSNPEKTRVTNNTNRRTKVKNNILKRFLVSA